MTEGTNSISDAGDADSNRLTELVSGVSLKALGQAVFERGPGDASRMISILKKKIDRARGKHKRVLLTDEFVNSVDCSVARDILDSRTPGFALRISPKGAKTFVLIARYPRHPKQATRGALGRAGAWTAEEARAKAHDWLQELAKGNDPRDQEGRQRAARARVQAVTFDRVREQYLKRHAATLRRGREDERILRNDFAAWGGRPASEITPEEIAMLISEIREQRGKGAARNALAKLRGMYSWALDTHEFGLTSNPTERLRPSVLAGKSEPRARILTEAEMRAVWAAATQMGQPFGTIFKCLLLTGQRREELAGATWDELDLEARTLSIPASRMKTKANHVVCLSEPVIALLNALPRRGPLVFSTDGRRPLGGFSRAKKQIDALSGVRDWVTHDLRRTCRSEFPSEISDLVKELAISHAAPGLIKTYDRNAYLPERARLMALWANKLLTIVGEAPPPALTNIATARAKRVAK